MPFHICLLFIPILNLLNLLIYPGYANEVGESFRSQVPISAVRFTYFVASSYVVADAYSKGMIASRVSLFTNSVNADLHGW